MYFIKGYVSHKNSGNKMQLLSQGEEKPSRIQRSKMSLHISN